MSIVGMGAVFALFLIPLMILGLVFIIAGIGCSYFVGFFLLVFGIVLKLVNMKLKWRSFSVYSTILIILGIIIGILSVVCTVISVSIFA